MKNIEDEVQVAAFEWCNHYVTPKNFKKITLAEAFSYGYLKAAAKSADEVGNLKARVKELEELVKKYDAFVAPIRDC